MTARTNVITKVNLLKTLGDFNSISTNPITTTAYLVPVRFPTMMLIGFEVALLIPAPVGVAAAVNETVPRFDGRQLQVAEKLELDPLANLFLHPGKTLPLTLNVTLDATETFAVITTTVR